MTENLQYKFPLHFFFYSPAVSGLEANQILCDCVIDREAETHF